jgi:hypothetical protein
MAKISLAQDSNGCLGMLVRKEISNCDKAVKVTKATQKSALIKIGISQRDL